MAKGAAAGTVDSRGHERLTHLRTERANMRLISRQEDGLIRARAGEAGRSHSHSEGISLHARSGIPEVKRIP